MADVQLGGPWRSLKPIPLSLRFPSCSNMTARHLLSLTYSYVPKAQGDESFLVFVKLVLWLIQDAVSPEKQVGEHWVDHPKPEKHKDSLHEQPWETLSPRDEVETFYACTHVHTYTHDSFFAVIAVSSGNSSSGWVPCLARRSSCMEPSKTTVLALCLNLEPARTQFIVYRTKGKKKSPGSWKQGQRDGNLLKAGNQPHHTPNPFFQKGRGQLRKDKRATLDIWRVRYLLTVGLPTQWSLSIPSVLPFTSKTPKQTTDLISGLPCN